MTVVIMENINIEYYRKAFLQALDVCRMHGLDWKKSIIPVKENKKITGFWVLDETLSTAIKIIEI